MDGTGQMRYRLDDNDNWTQPDSGDYGLPCAMASLLASWYVGNVDGSINWAENIAQRLFLPGCWDFRISRLQSSRRPPRSFVSRSGAKFGEPFGFHRYRFDCRYDTDEIDTGTTKRRRPISEAATRPVGIYLS